MKYSIGRKRRSQLQGHRKRRRILYVKEKAEDGKIPWTEYKTMKQYQTIGEALDCFRVYGYRAALKKMMDDDGNRSGNGHRWITED